MVDNENNVVIVEHATNTHGHTDLVFGLFDLLGLQYSARLHDIGDQKLGCIRSRELSYSGLHFTDYVQPGYIEARWDDFLLITGSFKLGYVTASLLSASYMVTRDSIPDLRAAAELAAHKPATSYATCSVSPCGAKFTCSLTRASGCTCCACFWRRRAHPPQAGRSQQDVVKR